jgi:hypothetical protein
MGLNEALLTYAAAVLVCVLANRLYWIWKFRGGKVRRGTWGLFS